MSTNEDIIAWLRREHGNDLSPLGHDYTPGEVADALEQTTRELKEARDTLDDVRELVVYESSHADILDILDESASRPAPIEVTGAMVERFKIAWGEADADGDTGNRVRRGLTAAFKEMGKSNV